MSIAASLSAPLSAWSKTPLWMRILGGLALGVVVGLIFGQQAAVLEPIGDLFIRLLRMLVAPLIFASLISGVAALNDTATMGRLGAKAIGLYFVTTAVAISFGLLFATLIRPGAGVQIPQPDEPWDASEATGLVERLLNIVPTNGFEALASGQVLQIIFFALIIGAAIIALGEKAKPVKDFFDSFAEVTFKITAFVMEVAPFGVFALIAAIVGTTGADVIVDLLKLIATAYAAMITHIIVVYGALVRFGTGLPFKRFLYGIADAQAVAYSTSSSGATLPVTIRCARENLGVDKTTASFVLPLGATINMDGTALYQGVIAVFAAQAIGADLGIQEYGVIVLTASLVSIGTAGIPSVSIFLANVTLGSVGLPLNVLPHIFGVDPIVDRMRTVTNVTGDSAVATVIAKSEKKLDEETFRARSTA